MYIYRSVDEALHLPADFGAAHDWDRVTPPHHGHATIRAGRGICLSAWVILYRTVMLSIPLNLGPPSAPLYRAVWMVDDERDLAALPPLVSLNLVVLDGGGMSPCAPHTMQYIGSSSKRGLIMRESHLGHTLSTLILIHPLGGQR